MGRKTTDEFRVNRRGQRQPEGAVRFHGQLSRCLLFLGVGVLLHGAAPAEIKLTDESPFLSASPNAAPVAQERLELRGIVCLPEGPVFCVYIYNGNLKKTTAWVRLNEPGPDLTVLSYDSTNHTIMVDRHGSSVRLTLCRAAIASAAAPIATAAAPPKAKPAGVDNVDSAALTPEERQARYRANFIKEREAQLEQERAARQLAANTGSGAK